MEIRPYEHWFSKYEDEDYYEDLNDRRREVKYAPHSAAALGGIAGGGLGYMIGDSAAKHAKGKRRIGAAIGAAGIGTLGYLAGRSEKKRVNKEADRLEKRYREGNKADRKYMRKRLEKQREREIQNRQAAAQEAIAWNTMWH